MQMNREEGFEAGENYRRLRFRRWEIILTAGPSLGSMNAIFPNDRSTVILLPSY